MTESELLARMRKLEERQAQLEYQITLLKQAEGRDKNAVNLIRSASQS